MKDESWPGSPLKGRTKPDLEGGLSYCSKALAVVFSGVQPQGFPAVAIVRFGLQDKDRLFVFV
jgi:hypothetical protein